MKRLIFFFFLFITLTNVYAQTTVNLKKATIYIFLSETCPICQSYTLTLKELYEKYNKENIAFIGVFSNYYANKDSMEAFKKKYALPFDLILDKNAELAKQLNATITPEVVVTADNKTILYSGRIDDSFYRIGKRRKVITSNDLDEALQKLITNQKIENKNTQAVGCLISFSK